MSLRSPVAWPVLELLDQELGIASSEPAPETSPLPADALFMASCDVFLTRDSPDCFTLTLKHRGHVSAIRLTAGIDENGEASLLALVE
jgi:hypothetical protein